MEAGSELSPTTNSGESDLSAIWVLPDTFSAPLNDTSARNFSSPQIELVEELSRELEYKPEAVFAPEATEYDRLRHRVLGLIHKELTGSSRLHPLPGAIMSFGPEWWPVPRGEDYSSEERYSAAFVKLIQKIDKNATTPIDPQIIREAMTEVLKERGEENLVALPQTEDLQGKTIDQLFQEETGLLYDVLTADDKRLTPLAEAIMVYGGSDFWPTGDWLNRTRFATVLSQARKQADLTGKTPDELGAILLPIIEEVRKEIPYQSAPDIKTPLAIVTPTAEKKPAEGEFITLREKDIVAPDASWMSSVQQTNMGVYKESAFEIERDNIKIEGGETVLKLGMRVNSGLITSVMLAKDERGIVYAVKMPVSNKFKSGEASEFLAEIEIHRRIIEEWNKTFPGEPPPVPRVALGKSEKNGSACGVYEWVSETSQLYGQLPKSGLEREKMVSSAMVQYLKLLRIVNHLGWSIMDKKLADIRWYNSENRLVVLDWNVVAKNSAETTFNPDNLVVFGSMIGQLLTSIYGDKRIFDETYWGKKDISFQSRLLVDRIRNQDFWATVTSLVAADHALDEAELLKTRLEMSTDQLENEVIKKIGPLSDKQTVRVKLEQMDLSETLDTLCLLDLAIRKGQVEVAEIKDLVYGKAKQRYEEAYNDFLQKKGKGSVLSKQEQRSALGQFYDDLQSSVLASELSNVMNPEKLQEIFLKESTSLYPLSVPPVETLLELSAYDRRRLSGLIRYQNVFYNDEVAKTLSPYAKLIFEAVLLPDQKNVKLEDINSDPYQTNSSYPQFAQFVYSVMRLQKNDCPTFEGVRVARLLYDGAVKLYSANSNPIAAGLIENLKKVFGLHILVPGPNPSDISEEIKKEEEMKTVDFQARRPISISPKFPPQKRTQKVQRTSEEIAEMLE